MTTQASQTQYPGLQLLGAKPSAVAYIRDLWRRREFATAIAAGEVRAQNMDTVLGNLWHVLNPILQAGIYYVIFGVLLDTTRGVQNAVAFIVIGVFIFHYSQKSIMGGAKSVVSNEGLIRSIRFPRAILPISTVMGQAIALIPALLILLVFTTAAGERPSAWWLLIIPVVALQTLFNIGLALFLARLTSVFRDIQNVLPFVFRLLFYGSGVLYAIDRFTDDPIILGLFDYNPFFAFLMLVRGPLMGEFPTIDPKLWLVAGCWTLAVLVLGFLYFRNGEHTYGR